MGERRKNPDVNDMFDNTEEAEGVSDAGRAGGEAADKAGTGGAVWAGLGRCCDAALLRPSAVARHLEPQHDPMAEPYIYDTLIRRFSSPR